MFDQFLGRGEIEYVDRRVGRGSDCCEVGAGEGDGDDAVLQDVEIFLGDVVLADGILEGEVEFVVLEENFKLQSRLVDKVEFCDLIIRDFQRE